MMPLTTHRTCARPVKRAALVLATAILCACAFSAASAAPAAKPVEQAAQTPDPFPDVIQKAMRRAGRSYKNGEGQMPDFLRELTDAQWKSIRFKPETALWRRQGLPFTVEFYHPGSIFNRTVDIFIADKAGTAQLPFSADMFEYGSKPLADKIKQTPPGYAGFRLTYPLNTPFGHDVIASFLGASYHQGAGKQSLIGAYARALALNTALPNGEEFPFFREFWFVPPEQGDTSLTICALMDSPSLCGAYKFVVTPGTSTVMDVEARLFLRKGSSWPEKIGIAPLTSMFLRGESGTGWPSDYRPEVHNSDGLMLSGATNEWMWSPLVNPGRLAVNTFPMENPRGFGLMQRDDNFDHYQDINIRFDRRSSVWVEPRGEWGTGRVELVEIPSTEEIHDNIVAFWVPDQDPPDTAADPNAKSFAYKLYWMTPGVTPHSLGRAVATRVTKSTKSDTARFIIDFESEALKAIPADTGLTSLIEAPENAPIADKQLAKNPATGGWRLSFSVRLPRSEGVVQSIISAREGSPRLRFKALLKRGENLPDPLTETWVYDLAF